MWAASGTWFLFLNMHRHILLSVSTSDVRGEFGTPNSRNRMQFITRSADAQAMRLVAELLSIAEYRRAILKGLIYSIGGVDSSLANAASSLLQQHSATG